MEISNKAVLRKIKALSRINQHLLIAIDGRCAAGKSTLAAHLQDSLNCNVITMDHFFLRSEQRTSERLREPGGNVDRERFLDEVLKPLMQGKAFSYRPFDCHRQVYGEAILVPAKSINIIEGSYSCHPALREQYDFRIFLTIDVAEQLRRIRQRNGESGAERFRDIWIPLEEQYFSFYRVQEQCDITLKQGVV